MFRYVLITHLFFAIIRILYVLYRDIDLSTEEAQYWLWSKHLDLSYYSKPPLIAYFNFISTSILGDTEIGVRINSIIFGFLITIIIYLFSKEIFKDEKLAFFISVFIYLIPAYDIASIIFLTDTPLAFFYLLLSYLFYKSVYEKKPSLWILTGISAGLAFLSKYSAVFFFPVAMIFVLFFKRDILKEKWFYISILIAGLFTLPVIYWNIVNDFVSFKHVGKLAGADEKTLSINLKHFGDYILGQIGINSVFLFAFMVYGVFRAFKEKDEKLIYLSLSPTIVFVFFGGIALFKNVEVNWPAFGYATLYILGGYVVYKRFLKISIILMFLSGLSIIILFYTPILDKVGLTNLLPPEKDPIKRLVGWQELGSYVKSLTEKYQKNFIFSDSYHISSELAFYVKPFRQTYCIRIDRRMNQFDLWEGIEKYENKGYYGIYVTDHLITEKVKSGFESLEFESQYKVKYRGKEVKTYYIYVLKNYKHIEEDPILSY
ncbi:MAG TPA: phospholipid carrier-dependent glycosyltransferase [Sulfurihydrogenibium sp.]|uniref:ArnT family glycosyltransferase n=1 Tax=Sulfurihydrogenibium sp. (strain YO3AOP1) TaxID=436114 RepID=UPI0001723733|nr:glycosyltransferase family 39 protein [Sulfurihydrogenibium sp. YO3AOP1]ACD66325.1 glycosyl transferase family 39 [Sulfurihydrogenibium sp. YO3AOP1]HBT99345.1 phospholipid carrier-dependent glycosyltransferase [Sulfurihydrogenibium sp.]